MNWSFENDSESFVEALFQIELTSEINDQIIVIDEVENDPCASATVTLFNPFSSPRIHTIYVPPREESNTEDKFTIVWPKIESFKEKDCNATL